MEFRIYKKVHVFEHRIQDILKSEEDRFSLFIGVLQAIKKNRYDNVLLATVEKNGDLLAVIQMTPPHPLNLILSTNTQVNTTINFLIQQLIKHQYKVPGVISMKPWATQFAFCVKARTGKDYQVLMDQGIYRLDQVNPNGRYAPGNWRYADKGDCSCIEQWYQLFEQETGLPVSNRSDIRKRVASFIKEKEIFLWEHEGKVVSMCKKARPTQNGVTVSLVFTPVGERRKGYAQTLVAACSKELLTTYSFCVLYTDLQNPTSNKIYQEIGFKKIADSLHIAFKEWD